MARSRRGASSSPARPGSRPASTYARPAAPPAPPAPVHQQSSVPAPQSSSGGGGMLAGIGSTIAQGMAFGTGSAIAHRAVGAVASSFGGGSSEAAPAAAAPVDQFQSQPNVTGPCASDKQMFFECLQTNKGDQQACQFLYDQLQMCQQTQTQFH